MDCLFCKIIAGEVPAQKIYEDDDVFAFSDIAPQAPLHFLVVPKKHIPDIMASGMDDAGGAMSALYGKLLWTAQALAQKLGAGEDGARFVINCKAHGGQTVEHLHVHVLGGRFLGWPPG